VAGAVLAAHLALLQGGWQALVPTRDRWVQRFTTRTLSVARPAQALPQAVAAATPPAQAQAVRPEDPPVQAPSAGNPQAPPVQGHARGRPCSFCVNGNRAGRPQPHHPRQPRSKRRTSRPRPTPGHAAPDTAVTPFTPTVLGVPQPSVMHYEVTLRSRGLTVQGQARLDWWHNGQQYDLRLELSAPGLRERVQHSAGQITEEGLAPDRFSDKSRGEQATHFDRSKQRLVFSNNRPEALAAGKQDPPERRGAAVHAAGRRSGPLRAGTQIAIPTASTREAEDWVFRVEGEEDLDLPGGHLRAPQAGTACPAGSSTRRWNCGWLPARITPPVRLRLTNPDGARSISAGPQPTGAELPRTRLATVANRAGPCGVRF
jgi:hypothetical protein